MKTILSATFLIAVAVVLVGFSGSSASHLTPMVENEIAEYSSFRLGVDCYQQKNYDGAMEYFLQAANQGDVLAVVQIGLMYDFGLGVQQNYTEARKWYLRAAEKGEPRAMYLVGHMYEFGEGVSIDNSIAFTWYLKSARQGHASAQFEIGKILTRTGRDTETYVKGVEWLKLAARQCHAKALKVLQAVTDESVIDIASCSGG
jgi:TPR repeat protein